MNRNMKCGDIWNNGLTWILIVVVLLAGIVVAVAVPVSLKQQGIHPAARKRDSTTCTVGEEWENESQMCAPRFHAPLAFEGSIMDGSHTACGPSFYHMMCGTWLRHHTNQNRAFSYAHRRIVKRLVKLVTATPGPLNRFYQSCLKRGSVGSARETRIMFQHLYSRVVEPILSHADLAQAFGTLAQMGYTYPFALSIEKHPLEPRVVPLLVYDNFPEELLNEDSIYQLLAVARDVTHYNMQEEQYMILNVLAISRALRESRSFQMGDSYTDYVKRYLNNHMKPWNQVHQVWQWDRYFQALAGPGFRLASNQTTWIPDERYIKRLLSEHLLRFTVPEWRSWLTFSILYNVHQMEPDLPDNAYFKKHDPVGKRRSAHIKRNLNTTSECILITEHMLAGLMAQEYLQTYMPNREADRGDVFRIVQTLRDALRNGIRNTTWLSSEDRIVLERKLNKTIVRVMEPNIWQSEPFADSISSDMYDHNLNLVRAYRVERNLAMWHAAAYETPAWDRNVLATFASPLTSVNAYYSGPSNSITILAGLMQHPFYASAYGMVSKYGIMGSVIGHELSHMLDHHGLYWDGQGNYKPDGILSPAGMSAFYNRTDCVIEQYGPAPAGCQREDIAYGNSTMGEDLADLTGINTAYQALLIAQPSITLGDRQHFFMVLAQAFCESYDQEHICDAVANDVHAIAEFRIDRTFRNLRVFHETFQCHEGHEMWRNETCSVY